MMSVGCAHWDGLLQCIPTQNPSSLIYKEECMLCFKSWGDEGGLVVCAHCFQSFCDDHWTGHSGKTGHSCRVRWCMEEESVIKKMDKDRMENGEDLNPSKVGRIEIPEERIDYHYTFQAECSACPSASITSNEQGNVVIRRIKDATQASRIISIGWVGEELSECEHVQALDSSQCAKKSVNLTKCGQCDLENNLWMCLSCGEMGCGRRQYDGSGGNGHAASHFDATHHPVSIKIGTVRNAKPDIYCYKCDAMVMDTLLSTHLSFFNLGDLDTVTGEKSMAELEAEKNASSFAMTNEEGKALERAEGVVGLENLGNSCYINAAIQSLYHIKHQPIPGDHDLLTCSREPKDCLACQTQKLWTGLESGAGKIKPWMFRQLIAKGHAEFSSSRQQDAAEFLQHLFQITKLAQSFTMTLQQTIECPGCHHCTHSHSNPEMLHLELPSGDNPVTLNSTLEAYFADELVDLPCKECGEPRQSKHYRLVSTPSGALILVFIRTAMGKDWVPCKVDTAVKLGECVDITRYIEERREDSFKPNPQDLSQLLSMGFGEAECIAVLKEFKGDLDKSLNHLLSGEPLKPSGGANEADISTLIEFGFSVEQARAGLKHAGTVEAAVEYIMEHPDCSASESNHQQDTQLDTLNTTGRYKLSAFISHKGSSMHCGHYIAHVRDINTGRWVMCNDERVVIALTDGDNNLPDTDHVYIAFYQPI